jgi:hypothetical protein
MLVFTEEDDAIIKEMREMGCQWRAIGDRLNISATAARIRGDALGLPLTITSKREEYEELTFPRDIHGKTIWPKEVDEIILKGCLVGKAFTAISNEVTEFLKGFISPAKVRERSNILKRSNEIADIEKIHAVQEIKRNGKHREPLPPGHPDTWNLLTNDAYPYFSTGIYAIPISEEEEVFKLPKEPYSPTIFSLCFY